MTIRHAFTAILALCLSSQAMADIPRTQAGHPDLSGTYNGATLTPMTRPKEFGNNRYLTKEEAEKITTVKEAIDYVLAHQ